MRPQPAFAEALVLPAAFPVAAPRRARSPLSIALGRELACLLGVALLAAPAFTPLAALTRWSFPVAALLVGGYLSLQRRHAAYVGFCIWIFILTPFVRRLADYHAGFSQANVMMLAPYLAASWAPLKLPSFFARGHPLQIPVAGVLLASLYGFVLAVANNLMFPGALDLLRWTTPVIFGCYLAACPQDQETFETELGALALLAMPLLGAYGVLQFVSPPPWDRLWMSNVHMNSIGSPLPFQVRVFSTLNSPGSLAFFVQGFLLIALTLKTPLRWPAAAAGAVSIALSLVRSIWLALAVGFVLLMVRGTSRLRLSILAMIVAGLSLAPLALANPRVEKLISDRVESLFRVGSDGSYLERSNNYALLADELADRPWGEGFGIANTSGFYGGSMRVIDGGPIEIFLSLGVIVGTLFFAMLLAVLVAVASKASRGGRSDIYAAAATVVFLQLIELSSTTCVTGEMGVLFWMCAMLALGARPRSAPA